MSKTQVIHYKQWSFPPGIAVGMDSWHMHHDERTYPKSFDFIPDRWLGNPKGPDRKRPLSCYMTSFGKGSRICVGMNLAYAEITFAIAGLFRRFDLELYQTTYEDVRIVRDVVAPDPSPQSKGVRVIVRSEHSGAPEKRP